MIGETIDRIVAAFSPRWGLERIAARATMAQIQSFSGGSTGGYSAGKQNRLSKGRTGSPQNENAQPVDEIHRLRWQSWSLFRDNPWAKKIVRSIISKTVGKGFAPNSQANNVDGTANTAFRERAQALWAALERCIDFRGVPGRGGLCFDQLQRLALQSVILSGDTLVQFKPIDRAEQSKRNSPIPFTLMLIDSARLYEDASVATSAENGNTLFRGIELDASQRRVAYHLQRYPLGYITPLAYETVRVGVDDILHLYVEDDIDQMRGVPWFASAIMQMRDTNDYQYNELKASAMAACVVLGYRKPTGATTKFGVAQDATEDTTDDNGNPVTSIQPGMMVNLGKDGALEGFNPARPGANAEAFIQHMLRAVAGALPGVKSSTVTGDYRNASFSSEKASDNDTWPEIEVLQEWFVEAFMQPVYEQILVTAITQTDWFDGVVTADEFAARRHDFCKAEWQGPISRSINPEKDVAAAVARIHGGLSSLQKECAALGVDWRDVLNDGGELAKAVEAAGLPEEFLNQLLGIDMQDVTEPADTAEEDAADTEDAADSEDMPTPATNTKGPANAKQAVTAS
jgi:lambda family phage portal protein